MEPVEKKSILEIAQGLKTLGDYRRAAKDPLFSLALFSESESTSVYDVTKTALAHSRSLIDCSRAENMTEWTGVYFPQTRYEMKNMPLFYCITLMEFAITYNKVQSVYELFHNWPKRPDVKARVFTSTGISYLEAAFEFVRELGSDIVFILQNTYKKYKKEGKVIYSNPVIFINKTPELDNLEINPVPDIIIKTWFDNIMEGTRKRFPENEFSRQKEVEAEFNTTQTQLEYEWNEFKAGDIKGIPKEPTKEMNQAYLLYTSMGISQADVAKKMNVKQYMISRWIKTVRIWRKHNGLPVDVKQTKPKINTKIDAAEKGKRTDGRKPTKSLV